jgi:magnesium transporter
LIKALQLKTGSDSPAEIGLAEVRSIIGAIDGVLWVDFDTGDPDGRALLEDFGFHPLAIEDCYNSHVDTPKVDDYGEYLFILAQSVSYSTDVTDFDIAELAIFLGSNYVISLHKTPIAPIEDLLDRATQSSHVQVRGADFLTHMILDVMVDQILPAVEAMDDQLDALERRILDRPDKALLGDVLRLKRNTQRLRRSILPQRDLVNRISRGEFGALIRSEAQIFYRDVYDHIVRVESMLDGLRDLSDSALSSYLSSVNNRMNEVMKALSVVASVFLPLTLIASIYGTNLDLSPFGQEFEHGFALMIVSMLAIAAAMILYFRHRGWF